MLVSSLFTEFQCWSFTLLLASESLSGPLLIGLKWVQLAGAKRSGSSFQVTNRLNAWEKGVRCINGNIPC